MTITREVAEKMGCTCFNEQWLFISLGIGYGITMMLLLMLTLLAVLRWRRLGPVANEIHKGLQSSCFAEKGEVRFCPLQLILYSPIGLEHLKEDNDEEFTKLIMSGQSPPHSGVYPKVGNVLVSI
ncbi:hypothetical protein Aduo_012725 [Ancylostoma duodenale]